VSLLIEKELRTNYYIFSRGVDFADKFFENNRLQIESMEYLKSFN